MFVFVIVLGSITYMQLPREQDPTINFNWIQITTIFPGASAGDIETSITEQIENTIRNIPDIRFVSSVSRDSVSSILVRFNQLSERNFDKRLNDLRREIQNAERKLPPEAERPNILELTSSNAFPSATIAVVGQADDDRLRSFARNIEKDLERLDGVDRVDNIGLRDPELQSYFDPIKAASYGVSPEDIANTIATQYRDQSAGTLIVDESRWIVRWLGANSSPQHLGKVPINTASGLLPLSEISDLQHGREKTSRLVHYQGKTAIILTVMKRDSTNILKLVDNIQSYVKETNSTQSGSGIEIVLLDDQTEITTSALNIMQANAVLGLFLVLLSTWLFLGLSIATLVAIGIPFTLAATFLALDGLSQTLNVSVLLGVVICLGMLVDDSVVVVESIYYRLSRGYNKMDAIMEALKEVAAPVTASVMTTIAAFLPLMLLPGILGQFMMVIPLVVCLALAFSLIEAYWMLPAHISALSLSFRKPSKVQIIRQNLTRKIRIKYVQTLIKIFRHPKRTLASVIVLFIFSISSLGLGLIKFNFFASDPVRLFYVNVEMQPGTPVAQTLQQTEIIEKKISEQLHAKDVRAIVSYAGMMFTETEPFIGESYGQVMVSLNPRKADMASVAELIEQTRAYVLKTPGPKKISYLSLAGGPPTSSPINVKVRGDDFELIREAVVDLKEIIGQLPSAFDITDNDSKGQPELVLKPNMDAIHQAGMNPASVQRHIRLLVDGEVVSRMQHEGEELKVLVKAQPVVYHDMNTFLQTPIVSRDGHQHKLVDLVDQSTSHGQSNIRHYNFRKAITVSGDIDKDEIDTVAANDHIKQSWQNYASKHPTIQLEFSGELDDIQESLDALPKLFFIGLGIMYLILGTQFRSYWQPFMILSTVPLALCGVIIGLIVTRNPMSLFTLYGVVALSGIAVNSAIVLISAANDRFRAGMPLMHSILYAARRRVIPILITSVTTIAGLFSLATGLGGQSLIWGPVATAIVWGLVVSTFLTLLVVPLLYRLSMERTERKRLKIKRLA